MADSRLNDAQVKVLDWVRAGCPADRYGTGTTHRLSARALETRGLVKIRGHGASWQIELTDAGRTWEQPAAPSAKPTKGQTPPPSKRAGTGRATSTRVTKPAQGIDVDHLLAEVVAAGGTLDLADDVDEARYRSAVKRSLQSSARPRGKRLDFAYTGGFAARRWSVKLADYFEDLVDEQAIAVPARVGKYHSVVRTFLDDRRHAAVTRAARPRAAKILEAIVRAVITSGGSVERDDGRTSLYGVPSSAFRLRATFASGHEYTVHISERRKRITHAAPKSERRDSWSPSRVYEYVATGELAVGIHPVRDASTRATLTDGKRALVEERLGELVRTMKVEAMYRDLRANQAENERLERRRRWEQAMERARSLYREDYERSHLVALADRWAQANKLRSLIAAMSAQSSVVGPERVADVEAALTRARALADSLDPTTHPASAVCEVPEPKPDDLKPFLRGLSPYGPNGIW